MSESWTDDCQKKLRGPVMNTRLYSPFEVSLLSVSELSGPTVSTLIPFSFKLDTQSFINETRGNIMRHTVWISSLSPFDDINRKWLDMKGKTFSPPILLEKSFKHLDHWGRLLPPSFASKFSLFKPKFMASRSFILIPWSRVSTRAVDQVSRKMTSNYMTVSDWRLLLPRTPPDTRPT